MPCAGCRRGAERRLHRGRRPAGRGGRRRALLAPIDGVDRGGRRRDPAGSPWRRRWPPYPPSSTIVLVHDAARALAPPKLIEWVAARCGPAPRGDPGAAGRRHDQAGRRRRTGARHGRPGGAARVQTPQGFRRGVLRRRAQRAAVDALTDDAGLVERRACAVHCVPGAELALKITRPLDLAARRGPAGTRRLALRRVGALSRVGIGTDVHAFEPGRDVLGRRAALARRPGWPGTPTATSPRTRPATRCSRAAGLGDLGSNFGTDRPEWAGASGRRRCWPRPPAGCGRPVRHRQHLDPGDRRPPEDRPRRDEAQKVLSEAVGAPVTVSGTTTDGLGLTGRGEGVAGLAVALVTLICRLRRRELDADPTEVTGRRNCSPTWAIDEAAAELGLGWPGPRQRDTLACRGCSSPERAEPALAAARRAAAAPGPPAAGHQGEALLRLRRFKEAPPRRPDPEPGPTTRGPAAWCGDPRRGRNGQRRPGRRLARGRRWLPGRPGAPGAGRVAARLGWSTSPSGAHGEARGSTRASRRRPAWAAMRAPPRPDRGRPHARPADRHRLALYAAAVTVRWRCWQRGTARVHAAASPGDHRLLASACSAWRCSPLAARRRARWSARPGLGRRRCAAPGRVHHRLRPVGSPWAWPAPATTAVAAIALVSKIRF